MICIFKSTTHTLLITIVGEVFTHRKKLTISFVGQSITSKFYSKYDAIDFSIADMKVVEDIKKARDKGPREKYPWPVTENHW